MVKALDVVIFFAVSNKSKEDFTNMRVNILAYYAQAWCLARLGRPLFADRIEAWEQGSVIPHIYCEYSKYRSDPIPYPSSTEALNSFTDEEIQLLHDVAREYGTLSTWHLRNLSHSAAEPWSKIYDPKRSNIEIPTALIAADFRKMIQLPIMSATAVFDGISIVTELPADWDVPEEDDRV